MKKEEIFNAIKGGLIVSCQALEHEPLHGSYIMSKMALAAQMGGAVGIRANSGKDIVAIKEKVNLPVIGIVKRNYPDSEVYITPTIEEVKEVVQAGAEIVAVDATKRKRPNNIMLKDFVRQVKKEFPQIILMADISDFEEGVTAEELGFDIVGTTLSGYTEYTKGVSLPNFHLMKTLVNRLSVPVIAEGGIWTPEQLRKVMDIGVHAAVVGTAITRPQEITKRFVQILGKSNN
jgi:N-acylglucosamine-6-phosphate 2-epimerase